MIMGLQSYRQLIAWQKAMHLVAQIYDLTKRFPKEEIYGLTGQIRRAAVSIPSNIAEGQGRDSTREFLHYLSIAYGSLMEVETQILIAANLKYLKLEESDSILEKTAETGRLINGLTRSLKTKI
ncbi:MAG: four helix bundle protein [Pyrinomonadaceae bacterium]